MAGWNFIKALNILTKTAKQTVQSLLQKKKKKNAYLSGFTTHIWAETEQVGEYFLQTSELCS